MARSGITKYSVQKARQALIAKGLNPSIDAIRVELGNTGSKSTISRYLKEIDAEEALQLEDEALLSAGIKEVIAKLASKLHQEANEVVVSAESRYQEVIDSLKFKYEASDRQLNELTKLLEDTESLNNQLRSSNSSLQREIDLLKQELYESKGLTQELNSIIKEKDDQIQILKESNEHTKENLIHYRESMKEQCEQTSRQHEQEVQRLQSEIRQLNQTLIVKQSDITNLNKDNSRLVTELRNSQKEYLDLKQKVDHFTKKFDCAKSDANFLQKQIETDKIRIKALESQNSQLVQENQTYKESNEEKTDTLLRLKVELQVKEDLLQKLGSTMTRFDILNN